MDGSGQTRALPDANERALHTGGPPHELLARMREEAPVHRAATGGREYWAVTRHDDVATVSRDTGTFSSHEAGVHLNPDLVLPLELARNLLLYKDPPEHTKYRKILQTAFVPNTVAAMEDEIRGHVTNAIDAFIEAGEADMVGDFAVPVPLAVLAQMLGLPAEDIPQLERWTHGIELGTLSPEDAASMPTFMEMAGYLHEQIARQIAAGGESLVTRMRAAEVDGERLTDEELLVFFGLLVFAGNDTVRNTTSSGILALLEHPGQWRALHDDPAGVPDAVEEILRYTTVVNYFCRTATADTELGGAAIKAGEKVMIWYTSGSRDEAVCPHAQSFDITRADPKHMAFGGGGRHFCLGAGLARLELRVIFEELTRRLPGAERAGAVERLESSWANALTALPVRFTPGEREGG